MTPIPADIHDTFTRLFPWVSLTQINSFRFLFHDFEYTVAPPYSGPYWQLGYKTRNATQNANSLNTLIFLPYLLTALYVFF